MKQNLEIVNVKCQWCANTITKTLQEKGIADIELSFTLEDSSVKRKIYFTWDVQLVRNTLKQLWYPEYGSKEAESLLKKAKSFVSCALWKV